MSEGKTKTFDFNGFLIMTGYMRKTDDDSITIKIGFASPSIRDNVYEKHCDVLWDKLFDSLLRAIPEKLRDDTNG